MHQVRGIADILLYFSSWKNDKGGNALVDIAAGQQNKKIVVWAKKMSKTIEVLSSEMKDYLTNSKVVYSTELKRQK